MISPRVPMTSSRTTLFCFGDGPLFLGAQCPNPRMATRHLRVMTPRLRETATAQSTGPYQKAQHAECEDADREFLGVLCGLCVQKRRVFHRLCRRQTQTSDGHEYPL